MHACAPAGLGLVDLGRGLMGRMSAMLGGRSNDARIVAAGSILVSFDGAFMQHPNKASRGADGGGGASGGGGVVVVLLCCWYRGSACRLPSGQL